MGILTLNAFAAADGVLVPLQCEYYALEGISMLNRVMAQLHDNGVNPRLELTGVVMTMYDGRTKLSQQVVSEVREHFGERVFDTIIPRNTRLAEAPSFGKPIIHYDKYSAGAAAYELLAQELLKRLHPNRLSTSQSAPLDVCLHPRIMNNKFAFFLCLPLSASTALAADWPQFRGPNHDGASPEKILLHWPSTGPRALWKTPLNDGFSAMTVADGQVFTLVTRNVDGADQEVCVANDAKTGRELWSAALGIAKYDSGGDKGAPGTKAATGP